MVSLPPLSIIIITLNEQERLPRLLDQLASQSYQNFEIIVSDSNSTDQTAQVAKATGNSFGKRFHFLQCGVTKGPGYGRNQGALQASHDYLLFLDADTQLPSDHFLADIISSFVKKNLDVAGCRIKSNTGNPFHQLGCRTTNMIYSIAQYTPHPVAVGAGIVAKKYIHEQINGFSTTIYLGEDSAYVQQAKKQGYKFRILPYRLLFDMRRIEQKGILKTLSAYFQAWRQMMVKKKFPQYADVKKVPYTFGDYKKVRK